MNSDVIRFRVHDKRELEALARNQGFISVSAFVYYKVFGDGKIKDTDSQKLDSLIFKINKIEKLLEGKNE